MKILNVDIPDNKHINIGLQKIYGVGPKTAYNILKACKISGNKTAADLSKAEINSITQYINSNIKAEGDLKRAEKKAIDRLVSIKSTRGLKHKKTK